MQSDDSLIQEYLAALRTLDLEEQSVLRSEVTVAYRRRRLLQRVAELDKRTSIPASGHLAKNRRNSPPTFRAACLPVGAPRTGVRRCPEP